MDGYINIKEIDNKPKIKTQKIDKVLSFNYTNTIKRIYKFKGDLCYIHGKATKGRNNKVKSGLILGFDDHYVNDADTIPELIPFEKYYQRIVNRVDNTYLDWIEQLKSEVKNTVFIYGHSLGQSDGDVLKEFLLAENTETCIYYTNEIDRAEKIKNLAIILGPKDLIKMTSSRKPKIIFIQIGNKC